MPRFTLAGWSFGINLDSLLKRAKVLARVADFSQLAQGTTADENARVAEIVNEAIEDYLIANPVLGQAVWTSSLPTSGYMRLQGTVATTSGSPTVTGTNTEFLTTLTDTNSVVINNTLVYVSSVASDTSLTLTANATSTVTGAAIYAVTTSALSRNIAIPTGLHDQDIIDIYFTDDSSLKKQRIEFIDPNSVWTLDPALTNGDVTGEYPQYWTWNEERNAISFIPFPSSTSVTIEIVYRQKPDTITADNISTPTSVFIYEIPTLHMEAMAYRVASGLVYSINYDLHRQLNSDWNMRRLDAQRQIRTQLAAARRGQNNETYPNGVIDHTSLIRRMPTFGMWR